jgi:AraC-like DNA-binding protein/tetratricopeptide (TPR) repeat protein
MRHVVHLIIIYAALLTLVGCGDGKSVRQLPHLGDTPYQQDTILVTYATNPKRALTLLDSALLLGNISEYRGQCIRARIYSKSLVEQHQDSAVLICKELLGHDSVRNNPAEQENILDLLIATCRAKPDHEQYMHWAAQKAELCQKQGEETERWRSEADVGYVMTHLGQESEGLAKLDEAISHLDAPGSIDRMDAFIVACKRKINALNELHRYDEVITLGQRILDRLNHFEQHAKDYAEDSYRLSWSGHPNDRDRYMDFSRAQAWGFMAQAYAMISEKGKVKSEKLAAAQKAREHLARFDNSNYGKTFGARRMIAPAQMALGMYDEALTTYAEIARRMVADTLNDDYAVILRSRAIAAHAKSRHAEAYDYQTRYADLSKVLSDSLIKGKAHEYAARYHDQEQKLEIAQMNAESQRKTIIIWAAFIIIMLISIFATWLLRQWRVIRHKNLVLVEQIGEAIEYKEKYESLTPGSSPLRATLQPSGGRKGEGSDYSQGQKAQQVTPIAPAIESELLSLDNISDDELFLRLRHAIKREHLYLDPSLDRQKIMDIFQLSKRRVGAAFAQGSEFTSLADFIRDCRLEYSCNLLVTRPDLSIKEVAAKSGFNYASTYSSDFKNRYTMTPSNYRELKAKK